MEPSPPSLKLVLLPGLDGTGTLFSELIDALPKSLEILTLSYPTKQFLAYPELEDLVSAACQACGPFVLIAESFSTPLAIKFAATNPPNLRGVVLCAGFATPPAKGWRRMLASLLAPLIFRIPLHSFAIKHWLIGRDAPTSLLPAVRSAISSVHSGVLAGRLRAVLACDVRSELSQISAPIFYIQAAQDHLVKETSLRDILAARPQVAVSTIIGPHLLLQRQPQMAAEAVVLFLRSCGPSKTS
jgi:pimeloyl-[acyl-carrier protein] methyl ester esterase